MRLRTAVVLALCCILLGGPGSSLAQQSEDEEQACLRTVQNIAQHIEKRYTNVQSQSRYDAKDSVAVACGVAKRAIDKVSEMRCSSQVVDMMTGLYDQAQGILSKANEADGSAFNCWATESDWLVALNNY